MGELYWRELQGKLGHIAYELTRIHFVQLPRTHQWQPLINAFRCEDALLVCVDLAGVGKEQIELSIESRRLILRGTREPAEPTRADQVAVQVLALEIDSGPFERILSLPAEVDPAHTTAEQHNGFLWIHLPLRCHG